MSDDIILVDDPAPGVRRITRNRPEKRSSPIDPPRGAILEALRRFIGAAREQGLTAARSARDEPFGDHRTS